jgi:hypothetical protein
MTRIYTRALITHEQNAGCETDNLPYARAK